MITVCEEADFVEGEAVRVVADVPIAVFLVDGAYYAIDDTCTHQRASLSDGWVEDGAVECPLHAVCFSLRTGMPSGPPAKVGVRTHGVRVEDGWVYVEPTPAVAPHEHARATTGAVA